MTTPAVRSLAQRYPGCQIDYLTQRPSDTIFAYNPHVRNVICVKWKLRELLPLLLRIYRERYDIVIDFSGSSKTAVFIWATRIPRRIGFASKKRGKYFTDRVKRETNVYSAVSKHNLLSALDINVEDLGLDFYLPPGEIDRCSEKLQTLGFDDRPVFAVSPVSKRSYKVWPAERFAEICDRLVEQYQAQIFFLIGPGESHFAEAVRDHMQQPCLPIDDSLSFYEASCVLKRSVCYVGNDNGLMHLSVASKCPTFGIFGRHKAVNWTSPLPLHHSIEFDPGCKSSCHYPACEVECLNGISVEAVWQELVAFLKEQAAFSKEKQIEA